MHNSTDITVEQVCELCLPVIMFAKPLMRYYLAYYHRSRMPIEVSLTLSEFTKITMGPSTSRPVHNL